MKKFLVILVSAVLSGCATYTPGPPPPSFYPPLTVQFDAAEVDWYRRPGTNTIQGNAVLRTVGGEARTCAGLQANIVPVSAYAVARMDQIFKNTARGYAPAASILQFAQTDPAYVESTRTVTCDSQGNFTFDRLPDGEYFVTAQVTWGVPQVGYYSSYTSTEGGMLMQRVRVTGGETNKLVLSNQ